MEECIENFKSCGDLRDYYDSVFYLTRPKGLALSSVLKHNPPMMNGGGSQGPAATNPLKHTQFKMKRIDRGDNSQS